MTRFIAGTLTLSSVSLVSAAAINQTPGVLSSNLKPCVGTVLTAGEVLTAEQAIDKSKDERRAKLSEELQEKTAEREALAKSKASSVSLNGKTMADQKLAEIEAAGAKVKAQTKAAAQAEADAEAKARDEAEAKAEAEAEAAIKEAEARAAEAKAAEAKAQAQAMAAAAEAKARDDAEAKAVAHQQVSQQQDAEMQSFGSIANSNSVSKPSSSGSVSTPEINTEHKVTGGEEASDVPAGSKYMGNYKLTFYCPCSICNGRSDALTASGTVMAEGRTIAVDKSLIPLGSKVYIKGFGTFTAEDTGSAIIGNHIDICVSSHVRAYELGVQYGDVYVLS